MTFHVTIGLRTYRFDSLKTLLAKASPQRSGDQLAGVAAATEEERVAAQMTLAGVPLRTIAPGVCPLAAAHDGLSHDGWASDLRYVRDNLGH